MNQSRIKKKKNFTCGDAAEVGLLFDPTPDDLNCFIATFLIFTDATTCFLDDFLVDKHLTTDSDGTWQPTVTSFTQKPNLLVCTSHW